MKDVLIRVRKYDLSKIYNFCYNVNKRKGIFMKFLKKDNKYLVFTGGFLFCLLIVFCIWGYTKYQRNKVITVEAVVQRIENDSVVVSDEDGIEYVIPNVGGYNVGDIVSFDIKNQNTELDPIEGEILKIETIQKSVQFIITEDVEEVKNEITEEEIEKTDVNSSNSSNIDNNLDVSSNEVVSEEDVVLYFSNLESEIKNTNSSNITSSIKSGFVTVVDFLFYDGTIKGKSFSALSDAAKLKVLKIAFSIDSKLEEKFPNYKEDIQDTGSRVYSNVKSKVLETYLNISTKVCQNNQDLCDSAKEGLGNMKKSFSLTWDMIKEFSGVGVSKLKSWYEIWRES